MKKLYYKEIDPPTMSGLIECCAEHYAERKAFSFVDGEGFTYGESIAAARNLALKLDEMKVPKGAHVMLLSQSSPWWGIAYLGITASGRVVVPVLPDFPEEDIAHIVKHSDSHAVLVSAKLLPKLRAAGSKVSTVLLEGFEQLAKKEDAKPVAPSDYFTDANPADLDAALSYFKENSVDPDSLCSIIYTSGTTGMSKGVMLSHRNILSDANSANPVPPRKKIVNTISILPLSHAYECTIGLFTPMTRGCHIHFLRRNLAPATLMPALAKVKPEMMMSVPLLLEKIYRKKILPSLTGSAVKRFIYKIPPFRRLLNRIAGIKLMKSFGGRMLFFGVGGAGMDPEVEKFLREAKFPYAMGYGLTETSPLVVGTNFWNSKYRSTGHLIPGVEVHIDNPDPKTGEGEIWVRGDNVMMGYYKDEAKTAEVMTTDGYFKTGDIGYMKGKHLYISGRIKNMILTANGENIYPEVIESKINSFDFVEESMVFQDKDKSLVARIHLNYDDLKAALEKVKEGAVHISKDAGVHLKTLQKKLNQQLSRFSQVKLVIEQKDPFKKTPTNKIKRHHHDKVEADDEENKID